MSRETKPGEALSDRIRESIGELADEIESSRKKFEGSLPEDGSREWEENTDKITINVQQPGRSYSPPNGTKTVTHELKVESGTRRLIWAIVAAAIGAGGGAGAVYGTTKDAPPPPMHAEPPQGNDE